MLITGRLVALQEELVTLKSELDFSHERTKAVTGQLVEVQEAKRALERTLEELRRARNDDEAAELGSRNEDGAVSQMVAVKERVLSMAYRKLSDSKEVILAQQEVIQNLEENLYQIKAEVCEQSHLREQLAEARGRNDKLEGLVAFLEAEKSALQDKVDKMIANDRDLVLGLDLPRATIGSGGGPPRRCLADVITSLEEERDRYRREAQRYKSLLGTTAPAAATANSPTQARRSKFVLAATFQGNVA
ncbi:centrosomal protein of 135 kDa-like [Hippocampus zosterae]|uniref:centrosomal protein of 135 kDa-like n=1 Tax=Hippocampus zosterae TaxID=109293 RepID=UPI00223E5AF9|nr:centrosomal protein of 135 kDa-like [Hippocampus zosterae]XP_051929726.1 centrosomal protein of 135 kDa-like [Hippocampus zosterae]XP_051929727.1 centrosomal protein of 135 kDa-like [Hippocampus zosterae]